MNKKLQTIINRALEDTKANSMAPVTIAALEKRLSEELDWLDACPGREGLIILLTDLSHKLRAASGGYSFLPDSFLLYLTGVTSVNPVHWDLPFSRFTRSVHDDAEIPFETCQDKLDTARKVLSNRENELVVETEPGLFEVTFIEGELLQRVRIRIVVHEGKGNFCNVDERILRIFGRGDTDGAVGFESDKMREWLTEFGPESMSDLVLLNALYWPGRIKLYPEIFGRKQNPGGIPSTGNAAADRILRDSYGILVYQEQALLLDEIGYPVDVPFKDLAPKGHCIGQTMVAAAGLWYKSRHTSLR